MAIRDLKAENVGFIKSVGERLSKLAGNEKEMTEDEIINNVFRMAEINLIHLEHRLEGIKGNAENDKGQK